MTASVVVRHNFETAHRLPFLPGKCTSLHGHSWWAEVSVFGKPDANGVLLEFGDLKATLRTWIDTYLDHGAMLGRDDRLAGVLLAAGCKVYLFDPAENPLCSEAWAEDWQEDGGRPLPWPTVENVAELLRRVTVEQLAHMDAGDLSVHVRVQETHVNEATAR